VSGTTLDQLSQKIGANSWAERPRLTWLWGLIIALSALKASSTLWLPTNSPLGAQVCHWLPGLTGCHGHKQLQ
jgi:hypothetical protein